jgi:thioredoxin 1
MTMKTLCRFPLMLLGLAVIVLTAPFLRAAEGAARPAPALPRLVDLGADQCIPCKMMKPVLDELTREYAGQLEVVFIDVWKNRAEGPRYGIRVIPTQIFYDAAGRERFRHEGFMAKKDILAKWRELGVDLKPALAAKES